MKDSQPQKIQLYNQVVFFRRLATLVNTGVPIVLALQVAAIGTKREKNPIGNILASQLTSGKSVSVSAAFSRHSHLFSPQIVALIKAGETGGNLPDMLERIAVSLEAKLNLIRTIKAALFYPAMVVIFSLAILIGLTQFVLPRFVDMFKSQDVKLPAITENFMLLITLISSPVFLLFLLVIFILTVYWWKAIYPIPENKKSVEKFLWSLPVVNRLMANIAAANFCQTFGDLYAGGLGVTNSLKLSAGTLGSLILKEEVNTALVNIETGATLSEAIKEIILFPSLVSQMLSVAENTGYLTLVMEKSAKYFRSEVESVVERLQAVLEPLILIVLGLLVGIFILVFFVPIYTSLSNIG